MILNLEIISQLQLLWMSVFLESLLALVWTRSVRTLNDGYQDLAAFIVTACTIDFPHQHTKIKLNLTWHRSIICLLKFEYLCSEENGIKQTLSYRKILFKTLCCLIQVFWINLILFFQKLIQLEFSKDLSIKIRPVIHIVWI